MTFKESASGVRDKPDRNDDMLASVLATQLAGAQAGGSVPGEDLHDVPVARHVNGLAPVQLKLKEVEPESNGPLIAWLHYAPIVGSSHA